MIKKYLYILLSGIVAGFFITIGAAVNLSILNAGGGEVWSKIVGALFFGIGLFCVIQFGSWLYTGKVGFTLEKKPKYLIDLVVCFVGNVIGCLFLSWIISLTRFGEGLQLTALNIVNAKQNDTWYSILLLSFMCGIMIYIAVKGHMICPYGVGKALIVFLAVATFILCGFEHVVANASYYVFARFFDWKAFGYFCLMFLGNGLGSIFIDGILKLILRLKPEEIK